MAEKKKSFELEKKLSNLESLVEKLEKGEISLDESLKLYEKGIILYNQCRAEMDKFEKKISKLTANLKEESME